MARLGVVQPHHNYVCPRDQSLASSTTLPGSAIELLFVSVGFVGESSGDAYALLGALMLIQREEERKGRSPGGIADQLAGKARYLKDSAPGFLLGLAAAP
jgi:hypothetical protein